MSHRTVLRYRPSTTEARIDALKQALEGVGCRVRPDPLWTQLYVEVPSDLTAWLTTGGMDATLEPYADAIVWSRRFTERPDLETHPPRGLPVVPVPKA